MVNRNVWKQAKVGLNVIITAGRQVEIHIGQLGPYASLYTNAFAPVIVGGITGNDAFVV
ncbi:hypothetical protein D3C72_2472690 [compost metagenome]